MGFWTPGNSVEEIRRLMDSDPAVTAGVEECEILTFLCPSGAVRPGPPANSCDDGTGRTESACQPSPAARAGNTVAPHDLDRVFRALADGIRRVLLDALYAWDGQTLSELYGRLPHMTRFGVMKHLRLPAAAGLVTSDKLGRERVHYLNPMPIRLIHDVGMNGV